jgi:ATP-dependent phosphofructokinase / diphosphate-dependent phosphofructokinase
MGTQDTLLVMHGGGPTAVINASLFGAVDEALRTPEAGRVLGALGGVGGILDGRFVDFGTVSRETLALLPHSPSSAIGTSRKPLEEKDYRALAHALKREHVRWLLPTGGNGTMNTCGEIWRACRAEGVNIDVVGIPKTMDNDIAVTDHAPGYASAALYMAASVSEVCCDVRGLPIHIVIVEAMGRNAGWVTAASALADESGTGGPDLIYLPERDFDEDQFLESCQELIDEKGSGIVVVSEGLHKKGGVPVGTASDGNRPLPVFRRCERASCPPCRPEARLQGPLGEAWPSGKGIHALAERCRPRRGHSVRPRGRACGARGRLRQDGRHRTRLERALCRALRAHPDRAGHAR